MVSRGGEERKMGTYCSMATENLLGEDKGVLETDGSDGHTTA